MFDKRCSYVCSEHFRYNCHCCLNDTSPMHFIFTKNTNHANTVDKQVFARGDIRNPAEDHVHASMASKVHVSFQADKLISSCRFLSMCGLVCPVLGTTPNVGLMVKEDLLTTTQSFRQQKMELCHSNGKAQNRNAVSYTHLRAHET